MKNSKNRLLGACLLCLAMLATSCGSKVENTPETIAAAVVKHLQAEEFDSMKEYCSTEGAMYVDGFARMFKETPLEKGLSQKGKTIHKLIRSQYVKLGDMSINENDAMVKYLFMYDDNASWQGLKMEFEKVEGLWKIVEFK